MTEQAQTVNSSQKNPIAKFPVYYGWVIMAAGSLGMIMTSPGQTYTESIFIEYLIGDLAISRSLISTLYSFGTLVGGFSLPFWGKQIDRRGTRRMMTIISILFGLSLIYMGFIQNAIMIGLGFILIRMLGQGSLGLASQTAINNWWVCKRGMIMGLSGLLMALLGMGGFPSLVYWLISSFGWRTAYISMGIGLLVLMGPVSYFLIRDKPEEYGLEPDGGISQPSDDTNQTDMLPLEENWTLKEALHTRVFWIIVFCLSLFALLLTGVTFHLVSIFQTRGIDANLAASVFIPIALTAAATHLLVGYLTDHMPLRFLLAAGLSLQALSMLMGLWIDNDLSVIFFGIMLGMTIGTARALGSVVWPKFYGRKYLGSIFGFTSALSVFGAALGPMPFGFAYDFIGSYRPALITSAVISFLLALLSLTIKKPRKNII